MMFDPLLLVFIIFILLKTKQMNQNLIYYDILGIKTVLTYKYSTLKSSAFHQGYKNTSSAFHKWINATIVFWLYPAHPFL